VINRLGFNNGGLPELQKNLDRTRFSGVLGVNIGKNKDTPNENAAQDYLQCLRAVYARASYVTVNISSPNTAGLRDLQQIDALRALLCELRELQARLASQHGKHTPMLVKVAPDLTDADLDDIAAVVADTGFEGVIATNTTIVRDAVSQLKHGQETGGLSGKPVFARSTQVLAQLKQRLPESTVLIGVGGILQGQDAAEKVQAGAQLVQFYTGLIYRGPALIEESIRAIRALKV
jgi:dihydroorotate dehydrogenase